MAKKLRSISLDKTTLSSSVDTVGYTIAGEAGSVYNLQVKDSSTPNKFYNFKTATFTNTFTSENTLSDVKIFSNLRSGNITIPASATGNEYRFLVFPNRHFDTDGPLLTQDITQESGVTVRFSTASDQGDTNFEELGQFTSSLTGFDDPVFSGASNTSSNSTKNIAFIFADGADGVGEGYKATFNTVTKLNEIADSLQPVESDFFIKFTKTASGNGSSATELVLTDIDNLVVGMSLVQIASTPVRISGSLGNFVFPTITAIDTVTKTITLSNAQSWSDTNDIIFRAYGEDLIQESVGLTFTQNLKVQPVDNAGTDGKLGTLLVTAATDTSVTVSGIQGVSAGSRIFGPGIDSTAVTGGFNNDVTAVNFGTGVLTMRGNQNVIADNTVVFVGGSSNHMGVKGSITITKFPSISTDVFFDVDRAVILSTSS